MNERLGEINKNKFGTEMKIIAYRKSDDIDIQFLDEVLSSDKVWNCEECKQEHIQLREWLKELREYRRFVVVKN